MPQKVISLTFCWFDELPVVSGPLPKPMKINHWTKIKDKLQWNKNPYLNPFGKIPQRIQLVFYSIIFIWFNRFVVTLKHIWFKHQVLSIMTIRRHFNKLKSKMSHCKIEKCWSCKIDTSDLHHYNDVIMSVMASQITSLTIVYSTAFSGPDQRKHQSSASLAFVWRIH